jgi:homoserine dehydrogenase
MKTVRLILAGLGNVNRGLLHILKEKKHLLNQEGISFKVTAVADSTGVALHTAGFDFDELLALKSTGRKVIDLPEYTSALRTEDFAGTGIGDILIESTPANLIDGNPGLTAARNALHSGVSVVFANKTPLVFAFDELHALSRSASSPYEAPHGAKIAYSATVCGGLPVINVLKRDLRLVTVKSIRGIMNATSNFILNEISHGRNFEEAVREAQIIGAAEADPSYDVNGNDTANKLLIILKTLGNFKGSIQDIKINGIREVSEIDLKIAATRGNTIKLIATAVPAVNGWELSVQPEEIPSSSFLGSCTGWEMGVEIETDLYEKIYLKNYEADPLGTSAAVLRDILDLVQSPE